jgi:two-component system LytT family response regulator
MNAKIKIAVIDDDDSMHDILKCFYSNSEIVEIKYDFTDPTKFIEAAPALDFDLCFLDISMPGLDGLSIAEQLGNKPVIFITGSDDKLREALELSPIDIITKPFTKARIDIALEKVIKLKAKSIEYGLFNVAECRRKICIHLPDILFVGTDDVDARNKLVIMKGGMKYTLMNYSLREIKSVAPHLIQVNKHDLVSVDDINEINHSNISLKTNKGIPAAINITYTHKAQVANRMFYS